MEFLIINKASVEKLRSASDPPTAGKIYFPTYFLPNSEDFQVVFHSKLTKITFRLQPHEGDTETAWFSGLKGAHNVTNLTTITLIGTIFLGNKSYLPYHFPHLAFAHHLAESLQRLSFATWYLKILQHRS